MYTELQKEKTTQLQKEKEKKLQIYNRLLASQHNVRCVQKLRKIH